jgi:hypothetical protein
VWRQFLAIGGGLLLVGGVLVVLGMGSGDPALLAGLPLVGLLLAGIGGMLFQAGLIGAAIGADWRSIEKGQERPQPGRRGDALVCAGCGETGNRVGSLYCRTCGAQL